MGYTLRIGEAIVSWSEDCVRIDVECVEHPAFGEPTDRTNQRWPSYTSWANFCRDVGMTDVMLNKRNGGSGEFEYQGKWLFPLMPEHPGAAPITKLHLEYIEEKIAAYKRANPDHFAQYPPPKPYAKPLVGDLYCDGDYLDEPRYDGHLCRAEWLIYWIRWAIDNCSKPVFVNS